MPNAVVNLNSSEFSFFFYKFFKQWEQGDFNDSIQYSNIYIIGFLKCKGDNWNISNNRIQLILEQCGVRAADSQAFERLYITFDSPKT